MLIKRKDMRMQDRLTYFTASEQDPRINNLLAGRICIADYVAMLPPDMTQRAYKLSDRVVRCMDERTPGGIRIAGSGILDGVDATYENLKDAGVTAVTRHEGCGAEAVFAATHKLTPEQAEAQIAAFQHALAEKLGAQAVEKKLSVTPHDLHVARVVWYTNLALDPDQIEDFPRGLVIHRQYQMQAQGEKALGLAPQIAMGDHGYGPLLTREKPLWIFAAADDEGNLAALLQEAQFVVEQLPQDIRERVRVDGFVANLPEQARIEHAHVSQIIQGEKTSGLD